MCMTFPVAEYTAQELADPKRCFGPLNDELWDSEAVRCLSMRGIEKHENAYELWWELCTVKSGRCWAPDDSERKFHMHLSFDGAPC